MGRTRPDPVVIKCTNEGKESRTWVMSRQLIGDGSFTVQRGLAALTDERRAKYGESIVEILEALVSPTGVNGIKSAEIQMFGIKLDIPDPDIFPWRPIIRSLFEVLSDALWAPIVPLVQDAETKEWHRGRAVKGPKLRAASRRTSRTESTPVSATSALEAQESDKLTKQEVAARLAARSESARKGNI